MTMKLATHLIENAQALLLPPEDKQAAAVWSGLSATEQRAVTESDDPTFVLLRSRSRFDGQTGERVVDSYSLARPHWLDFPKTMGGQCWAPRGGAEFELARGLDRDSAIRLCYRVKAYGLSRAGVVK
jgi:hypothetical protein